MDAKAGTAKKPRARGKARVAATAKLPRADAAPRGDARRKAILRALHGCVVSKGYSRTTLADVAETYLYQLAAYRMALGAIFPGKAVRAALLWTDGPTLMEIPSAKLDDYAEKLWTLDPSRLDA